MMTEIRCVRANIVDVLLQVVAHANGGNNQVLQILINLFNLISVGAKAATGSFTSS
jgi:hypothetical protein